MKSLARHQFAYAIASEWRGAQLTSAASLAQGYPIELRALGTMQTLAFSMGKDEAGHRALASAIAMWVLSPGSGAPLGSIDDEKRRVPFELLQRLSKASRAEYLAADAEAIAFADSLKTISKALAKSRKASEQPTPRGGR